VEGVENEYHVRLLQLLGCDLLQGYEIGAPMPIEDIIKFRNKQCIDPLSKSTNSSSEILQLQKLGIQLSEVEIAPDRISAA
jgi:predicted signal transduction protein with EAL and GGDEF domain